MDSKESVSVQVRRSRQTKEPRTVRNKKHKRTGKFQNFSSEVLQDSRTINGGLRSDPDVILRALLQVSVDTTDRELKNKLKRINIVPTATRKNQEPETKKVSTRVADLHKYMYSDEGEQESRCNVKTEHGSQHEHVRHVGLLHCRVHRPRH